MNDPLEMILHLVESMIPNVSFFNNSGAYGAEKIY